MTDHLDPTINELPSDVPVEQLPILNTPDALSKFDRLRTLKKLNDELFSDKKDANGVPAGEFGKLKIECGALAAVAGVKSVVYLDLRVMNTEASKAGDPGSGSVDGGLLSRLIFNELVPSELKGRLDSDDVALVNVLLSIISAARGFDEDALSEILPPHVIGRSRGIGKGRASSTRVEWVGSKGRGKMKAGSTGQVQ